MASSLAIAPVVVATSTQRISAQHGTEILKCVRDRLLLAHEDIWESPPASYVSRQRIPRIFGDHPPPYVEVYDHHAPFLFPKWSIGGDEAKRMLRESRRRATIAKGESGCPQLAAGHVFALVDHPISRLDET